MRSSTRLSDRRRWLAASVFILLSAQGAAIAQEEAPLLGPVPEEGYALDADVFVAHVEPDGSVTLVDRRNTQGLAEGWGMDLDVTDIMMRQQGRDPYASAKLQLLDRTRDVRVAHGREYRLQRLAQADQLMRENIDVLWASTPDPAIRKQVLFELWDECAESGEPELVAAGEAARRVVEEVIRRELTGELAYSAAELSQLNARRTSRAAFDPYIAIASNVAG